MEKIPKNPNIILINLDGLRRDKISKIPSLQNLEKNSPFLRGFSDECLIPISRWTEVKQDEIDRNIHLKTLLGSPYTGPCLVEDYKHRAIYIFNHFESGINQTNELYERLS